jgi:LuxR family maltose regulon positive regulatory protein
MLHRSIRDFYEFLNESTKATVHKLFSCFLSDNCECFYQSVTAGLLTEQNKLNEALNIASNAYNNITDDTSNEIYFGISLGLAEIYSLKSDREQYRFILNKLYQRIEINKAQYLLKNLTAYEERMKIWDCDQQAAEDWLNNYFIGDTSFGEFYKIYQNFTTVRAYIVLSMTDKAVTALEQMKNLCENLNRPLDTAEAGVLMSIIEWISGKKKESRIRLYNLLADLQPYGFIRVVANEGKAVLPILTAVIKEIENKKSPDTEADKAMHRYVKEVYMAAYVQSKRFKGLTYKLKLAAVKLSPKQTLVLELLSKGHNNAEIVKSTGLSLNTIRSHTKIAYKKLEVTTAFDAVVKAKQLNILQ